MLLSAGVGALAGGGLLSVTSGKLPNSCLRRENAGPTRVKPRAAYGSAARVTAGWNGSGSSLTAAGHALIGAPLVSGQKHLHDIHLATSCTIHSMSNAMTPTRL